MYVCMYVYIYIISNVYIYAFMDQSGEWYS